MQHAVYPSDPKKGDPRCSALSSETCILTANVKNRIDGLNQVRGIVMQTLKELREKINHLEDERARLSAEVEDLRKAAEARVAALEGEVSQLRKDVNSLREFLRP
jgi:predicted  nucleic acid-binding Zn-ribbon protein